MKPRPYCRIQRFSVGSQITAYIIKSMFCFVFFTINETRNIIGFSLLRDREETQRADWMDQWKRHFEARVQFDVASCSKVTDFHSGYLTGLHLLDDRRTLQCFYHVSGFAGFPVRIKINVWLVFHPIHSLLDFMALLWTNKKRKLFLYKTITLPLYSLTWVILDLTVWIRKDVLMFSLPSFSSQNDLGQFQCRGHVQSFLMDRNLQLLCCRNN